MRMQSAILSSVSALHLDRLNIGPEITEAEWYGGWRQLLAATWRKSLPCWKEAAASVLKSSSCGEMGSFNTTIEMPRRGVKAILWAQRDRQSCGLRIQFSTKRRSTRRADRSLRGQPVARQRDSWRITFS